MPKVDKKKIFFIHFLMDFYKVTYLVFGCHVKISSELSEFFSFFCVQLTVKSHAPHDVQYLLYLEGARVIIIIRIRLVLVHEVVDASLMCSTSTKRPISIVYSGKSLSRNSFYRLL